MSLTAGGSCQVDASGTHWFRTGAVEISYELTRSTSVLRRLRSAEFITRRRKCFCGPSEDTARVFGEVAQALSLATSIAATASAALTIAQTESVGNAFSVPCLENENGIDFGGIYTPTCHHGGKPGFSTVPLHTRAGCPFQALADGGRPRPVDLAQVVTFLVAAESRRRAQQAFQFR